MFGDDSIFHQDDGFQDWVEEARLFCGEDPEQIESLVRFVKPNPMRVLEMEMQLQQIHDHLELHDSFEILPGLVIETKEGGWCADDPAGVAIINICKN